MISYCKILKEDGGTLLNEDGSNLLLENYILVTQTVTAKLNILVANTRRDSSTKTSVVVTNSKTEYAISNVRATRYTYDIYMPKSSNIRGRGVIYSDFI